MPLPINRGIRRALLNRPPIVSAGGGPSLTRSASGLIFVQDAATLSNGNLAGQNGWHEDKYGGSPPSPSYVVSSGLIFPQDTSNAQQVLAYNDNMNFADGVIQVEARSTGDPANYMASPLARWVTNTNLWATWNSSNYRELQFFNGGRNVASSDFGPITHGSGYTFGKLWMAGMVFKLWDITSLRVSGTASVGNTAAGKWGFLSGTNNATNVDIKTVAAYTDYRLYVTGLSGSQAFRLFNASNTPIVDSATQSGGIASVDICTAVASCPFTGYLVVYTDTSWSTPVSGWRYPSVGTASDIYGGDSYLAA